MSDNPSAPTTEPTIEPTAPVNGEPLTPQPEPGQGSGAVPPEPSPEPVQGAEPVTAEPPEGGEEEEGIASFADLTEFVQGTLEDGQQLGEDWLDGLSVQVKVNGESVEATFKDLVDGFQMREASERRLTEAKAKAKEITEAATEKAQALDAQFTVAANLIKNAESFLNDDIANIDWQKLRTDDPAEYAAKRDDMKERRQRVEAMKAETLKAYQDTQEKVREEAQKQLQDRLPGEHKALLQKVPEWSDVEKRKKGASKAYQYLINEGFTEQEAALLDSDHRLLVLAHKARLHDDGKARSAAMKKKVVKVPKVIKPGAKHSGKRADKPKSPEEILYG